ncbi:hypothetical protein G7Z17_g8006 [Cylindrodendrum hubeiense]|uniref:Uncharacterized protein n=1 Tax=Cylindrodendrum hubeiense TaxID=595255 RepID=A0A9P5H2T1_9HYPO|nr:hypothetical protein G7Z17_g8006 [Cylindrodendrum hubeiense]
MRTADPSAMDMSRVWREGVSAHEGEGVQVPPQILWNHRWVNSAFQKDQLKLWCERRGVVVVSCITTVLAELPCWQPTDRAPRTLHLNLVTIMTHGVFPERRKDGGQGGKEGGKATTRRPRRSEKRKANTTP